MKRRVLIAVAVMLLIGISCLVAFVWPRPFDSEVWKADHGSRWRMAFDSAAETTIGKPLAQAKTVFGEPDNGMQQAQNTHSGLYYWLPSPISPFVETKALVLNHDGNKVISVEVLDSQE